MSQAPDSCPQTSGTSGSKKRGNDPSVQCSITNLANSLIVQMAPGGPFDSLLQMLGQVPQQAIQPIVSYIQGVGNSGTASNLGLAPSNTAQAIKLACWIAYSVVVLVQTSSTVWDIPASDLVGGSSATTAPSSSASPCPTGILMLDCDYENCDGNLVINLCGGTSTGQWKNCPCNSPDPLAYAPYDSVADLQQALNTL